MKKRPPTDRPRPAKPAAAVTRVPTYDDILAIAKLIEAGSRFTEFRLRSGDIEVEVRRAPGEARAGAPAPAAAQVQGSTVSSVAAQGRSANAPANDGVESAADLPRGTEVIRSPMVGTFYRAPEPSAPPFVEQGSRVKPDTIVCLIEVMKLMNSVTAGVEGVVTDVFVENAQMVEFGQPLVAIKAEK